MNKKEFDLQSQDAMKLAFFLSNGQIVMLTCTNAQRSINGIISLGWAAPTSFVPFLLTASVGSGGKETGPRAYRVCYSLINETKEFGLNVPTVGLIEAVGKVGSTHSDEIDKFARNKDSLNDLSVLNMFFYIRFIKRSPDNVIFFRVSGYLKPAAEFAFYLNNEGDPFLFRVFF